MLTKAQAAEAKRAMHEVLNRIDNKAKVARAVGLNPQAIQGWIERGRVPPNHVAAFVKLAWDHGLEHMTATRLCPDVFPAFLFARAA